MKALGAKCLRNALGMAADQPTCRSTCRGGTSARARGSSTAPYRGSLTGMPVTRPRLAADPFRVGRWQTLYSGQFPLRVAC